jgi:hypothetical protein
MSKSTATYSAFHFCCIQVGPIAKFWMVLKLLEPCPNIVIIAATVHGTMCLLYMYLKPLDAQPLFSKEEHSWLWKHITCVVYSLTCLPLVTRKLKSSTASATANPIFVLFLLEHHSMLDSKDHHALLKKIINP